MRFLRIVPFVAIVLLTASAQNEYLEQLELEIEAMDETMADDDAFPDLEFFTGMLQAGATEGIPLLLVGGTSYQAGRLTKARYPRGARWRVETRRCAPASTWTSTPSRVVQGSVWS
jgi:hypothetical protein